MIASLVVTLKHDDESNAAETLERLKQQEGIEIGARYGQRLPLTLEAEGAQDLASLTNWVQGLSGVLHVDIVFASFEPTMAGE